MNFRDFAKLFSGLDSPLGDLASDILRDQDFDDSWDADRIKQYLEWRLGYDDRTAMVDALVALFRFV